MVEAYFFRQLCPFVPKKVSKSMIGRLMEAFKTGRFPAIWRAWPQNIFLGLRSRTPGFIALASKSVNIVGWIHPVHLLKKVAFWPSRVNGLFSKFCKDLNARNKHIIQTCLSWGRVEETQLIYLWIIYSKRIWRKTEMYTRSKKVN